MLRTAKAILANPATYEAIDPRDFGMQRYVHFASRLTGWNAIKSRCTLSYHKVHFAILRNRFLFSLYVLTVHITFCPLSVSRY